MRSTVYMKTVKRKKPVLGAAPGAVSFFDNNDSISQNGGKVKMVEEMKDTAKAVGEVMGAAFIAGEFITLCALVRCTSSDQPFPDWFKIAFPVYAGFSVLLAAGVAAVISYGVARLIHRIHRRHRRNKRPDQFFSETKGAGVTYIRVSTNGRSAR